MHDTPPGRKRDAARERLDLVAHEFLGSTLLEPAQLRSPALEALGGADFENPRHAVLFSEMVKADADGIDLGNLHEFVSWLSTRGTLDAIGGHGEIFRLVDEAASGSKAPGLARIVRRAAIEREIETLHARAAVGERNASTLVRIGALESERDAIDAGRSTTGPVIESIAFSGERLLALLDRPAGEPVEAARPVAGHLTLIVAPSFTGKTSLALWLAMARAAGVAPWAGDKVAYNTTLKAGRVLLYSLDEAPEQVARRMRGLATFHPAGPLERYAERLVVIGPDRELDGRALDALRFDERGLATLTRWLERAERDGEPFTDVFVDAYADVLPLGESENSNEEATRIGGALERLAVRFGCAIALLHHVGKPKSDTPKNEPADVRFLARGASAITAKARCVISLEQVAGMSHLRRVRTATNLGPAPKSALFQVCAENSVNDEILYFKPAPEPSARNPQDYLDPGEWISTNELARRIAGDALADGAKPSTELKALAARTRSVWADAGLIDTRDGKRRAKELALRGAKDAGTV